jgi:chemotaxis protein histidine kinase CheA
MDEAAQAAQRANPLTEVANDLLEFARSLRELYEPVADENLVISRFIRQFRQELVQLRRSPMSDLFRRLQRAVRDAAAAEGKKVRLELIGDHAGLERSLQERLYEPLLHIVRNAVSHGIEPEDQRTARGKPPSGTITLEARGGTNLLLVEVRDDGRGLDYDALRRRGVERGLLSGDRSPSREELAQLIFRPGFSTRDTASEISGRGVGMDVVAATLDRMRGWVEVESTPGHGMTIRLTVPLRSVIEHAMVFRAAGQLFAVPMPYVQQAAVWDSDVEQLRRRSPAGAELRVLDFRELFSMPVAPANAPSQMLLLGHAQPALTADEQTSAAKRSNGFPRSSQHVALLVDEVVGPEEVVVRPLPALLKHRRLFSGVTLAGTGQMVLLFDARRLIERGLNHAGGPQPHKTAQDRFPPKFAARKELSRFLVVDDSPSTRRSLTQMLERRGFTTTEAGDGLEAVSRLRDGHFAAVFTDLEMPRLGGMELLRQIKSRRETRCLPVVIVSSCQEAQHRDRAKELGATDYLAKPVSDEVLTETIERIMAILEATKN